MSLPPIVLSRLREEASDDATVSKYTQRQPVTRGQYTPLPACLPRVPPLAYFCVRALMSAADQIHLIGDASIQDNARTIIESLFPDYEDATFDVRRVDPRLWATLAQLYPGSFPPQFRYYYLPLADENMHILQAIPSTINFSLVTILELPGCEDLDDTNIVQLKALHSLTALEASGTSLTDYGLLKLSKTLAWDGDGLRRGPWQLRLLRLRNCEHITGEAFTATKLFPLLSALDFRGTKCSISAARKHSWYTSRNADYFHPTPLRTSLAFISSNAPETMFSSVHPHYLCVDELSHRQSLAQSAASVSHPSVVTLQQPGWRHSSSRETECTTSPYSRTPIPMAGSNAALSEGPHIISVASLPPVHSASSPAIDPALFYRLPKARKPAMSSLDRNYRNQEFDAHRYGNEDSMFYRRPPPWSTLNDHKPPTPGSVSKSSGSNSSLDQPMKVRRMDWQSSFSKPVAPMVTTSVSVPSSIQDTLKSGNPFRRKALEPATTKTMPTPSPFNVPAMASFSSAPLPSPSPSLLRGEPVGVKRVRPISAINVPDLPDDEKKKLRKTAQASAAGVDVRGKKSKSGSGGRKSGGSTSIGQTFDMKAWLTKK